MRMIRDPEPNSEKRLDAFMIRRREELLELCKTSLGLWSEDAIEKLKVEFYRLRGPMVDASIGGTIEYAFVLSLIADYFGTRYGQLTREELRDMRDIWGYVAYDFRVYIQRLGTLVFNEDEHRLLELMRDEIGRLHNKLRLGRPD